MWTVMTLSVLSGLSTPLGALIVLRFRTLSGPALAFILALASGVMVTVVLTELLPNSLKTGGIGWFTAGCFAGVIVMVGLAALWRHVDTASRAGPTSSRLWQTGQSIALAIAVHDLPEGMAIGAGDGVHAHLGFIIALAMALHNLPEGMSIAAPLAMGGMPRRKILTLTGLISFVTPFGTLLPLLLGALSPAISAFFLALASGAMLYVVAHDTFPEAWQAHREATVFGVLAGAALMAGVTSLHAGWLPAVA